MATELLTVKMPPPKVTLPAPASERMASLKPFKSRMPAALTVTAEALLALPGALNRTVPALMVVAPVYVFAPPSASSPVPFLISVPAPPPSAPLRIMVPALVNVVANVALRMFASRSSVPASALRVAAAVSVMVPLQELLPPRLRSAPPLARPVPLRLNVSPVTAIPPCNCNCAPLATVVPSVVPPSARLLRRLSTPALTVVRPA